MPNQILDALMQYLTTPQGGGRSNMTMSQDWAGQTLLPKPTPQPNVWDTLTNYLTTPQGGNRSNMAMSLPQTQTTPQPMAQPQATPINPYDMGFRVQGTPDSGGTATALPADRPQGSPSPVMEFLRQMGIPLASAAVGLASPQMLPGAAGMATGFAGEMSKEREYEKKLAIAKEGVPTYTFNPDTGQYEDTGVRVPRNAKISRLTSDQQNKLQEALDKIILGDSKGTEQITQETKQKFNLGDAPEASKYKDGAVLKDESGNPIAINKGGSWQSIQ